MSASDELVPLVDHSDHLGELFKALSLAQGQMTDPPKTKTAKVGTYSYRYADLADVLQIVRPIFADHGLAVVQFPVSRHSGTITINTYIGHESGQWIESEITLPLGDDRPQTLGSMITYARRYALCAVAGIAPDEDEDGQVGQAAVVERPAPVKVTKVSHDHQKQEGYDPKNQAHKAWLDKALLASGIPEKRWKDIEAKMLGKPASALDEVLRTAN